MYETMRRAQPDFFIHCGDTIYADVPASGRGDAVGRYDLEKPGHSGQGKSGRRRSNEFRGNYLYNLLDDNMRRFNAEIPQFVLWDDHEVRNNWYPSNSRSRALASQARRAFLEYNPIRAFDGPGSLIYRSCPYGPQLEVFALDLRTYRGANSENRQTEPSDATALAGGDRLGGSSAPCVHQHPHGR